MGDGLGNFRIFFPVWIGLVIAGVAVVSFSIGLRRVGFPVTLIAIAVFATIPVRNLLQPGISSESIRTMPEGVRITIEGILFEEPEHLTDRTHLMIRVARAAPEGATLKPSTGIVRITVLEPTNARIGDEISITAKLRFPRNNGNPGEFDYAAFLKRSGIAATATLARNDEEARGFRVLAHHPRFPFTQLQNVRDRIADLIDRSLPPIEAGEMRALVIGDRSGIDEDLRNSFARTGMAHLLVISGLHLGFVAAAIFALVRFLAMVVAPGFASRGWANKFGAIAASIAVCAYTAIAGHHVSTIRAMIMVLAYTLAIILDRASDAIASLALAAIVICLVIPGSTADVGFQLSFASVLGIVLGMRRFSAWIKMRQRRGRLPGEQDAAAWKLAERPLDYVAVSFWAMIVTAPLTAFQFNQVAFVGLMANAIVVPIMGFGATLMGLLGAMCGLVWEPAGSPLLLAGSFAIRISNGLAAWFEAWPVAWAHMFTPTLLEMALAYGLIALWLSSPLAVIETPVSEKAGEESSGRQVQLRTAALVLVAVTIAADAAWWVRERYLLPELRVTFLSVGEGDAAVVRFPGRRVMLIDAGGAHGGYDSGERVIAPYLWSRKILHVDYLVLSHPDADHFGGFTYIADNFGPKEFWAPDIASPDRSYAELMIALMRNHLRLKTIDSTYPGEEIGGVRIQSYVEASDPLDRKHNNGSAVLRLGLGKVAYLFTGDIEAPAESALIQQRAELGATVLKVPHHGSRTSSTQEFIAAVHPSVAVISDGYMNRFHFPASEVMARYHDAGVKVLRTDLNGAVITAATPYQVTVQSAATPRFALRP